MAAVTALAAASLGSLLTWQAMAAEVTAAQAEGSRQGAAAADKRYQDGYAAGRDAGYDAGKQAGYDEGKDEGWDAGYEAGKASAPTASSSADESSPSDDDADDWSTGTVWIEELTYGTRDSDSVRHLQWALSQLGYDVVVDGNYLEQTDQAVREWQESIGNTPDSAGESSLGQVQADRLFAPYPGLTTL